MIEKDAGNPSKVSRTYPSIPLMGVVYR